MAAAKSANLNYVPLGDQAVVVQFENTLSIEVNRRVQSFAHIIEGQEILGITQLIITFNTLAVCYDPLQMDYQQLVDSLRSLEGSLSEMETGTGKRVFIPVAFGGKYGPDLEDIAAHAGLSTGEVIKMIYNKPYYVYMVGFIAGFPYCGDLDQKLWVPRRANPRVKVQKGSVCIANNQTGVYTIDSPGGWHIVGWTPIEMFNPYREQPGILLAGDLIQYIPITVEEAEQWDEKSQKEWDQKWSLLKS